VDQGIKLKHKNKKARFFLGNGPLIFVLILRLKTRFPPVGNNNQDADQQIDRRG
jgi:hypothetical protein